MNRHAQAVCGNGGLMHFGHTAPLALRNAGTARESKAIGESIRTLERDIRGGKPCAADTAKAEEKYRECLKNRRSRFLYLHMGRL